MDVTSVRIQAVRSDRLVHQLVFVYTTLAGVKRSERRKMFNREETLNKEPLVKRRIKGGGYYVEYRTDDARLTIEVMKEGIEHGAKAVNYAK